ncbi:MAG: sugar phosphate isomerase/epimerase [Caldilineaceae bacterium SB0670_bin_27]|uniref:Sugar phosphate isomerase/epimerase n=1 Tax=Caldilineaceae bacterium SB0664_bin_27 TaxID=2605260 RepID=A0A6B0YX54_9CHLR|nr:sugar phosphate isomerase/epimerase [Caldilineaceae bacterium SB0664_bin_27]MYJ79227.1 sugar phosphate isomerase/epimerase [Caldilineaceae bacterium SB0670_bin_27]
MSRISTSSWSLHRALGSPPLFGPGDPGPGQSSNGSISLLELPSAVAQANINTLEIVHFHFPTTDAAYVDELRAASEDAGIELFSILIDAGDITHADGTVRAKEMAWIRLWLELAARCGASHARVVGGYVPVERNHAALLDHPVLQRSAKGLRELADYGTSIGVQVITENFRETTDRADQVLAILELCEGRVGLCADFGNYQGEDRYDELAAIFPKADSAHVKALYDEKGQPDENEFRHSLGMLSNAGFDGPMSLIFDTPLHGKSTEWDNLAQLRKVAASFCD